MTTATIPIPTAAQRAWMGLEYSGFVHLGMSTFAGVQHCEPGLDPDLFHPTDLDCRQWAQVAKDAGMKMLVLTAKHHDGFCNWPSAQTDYTVAASAWRGGRGDLVADCARACEEAGLAFGLYLSPFDKHHGSGTAAYAAFYDRQLHELLEGRYGRITLLWLDGFGARNIGRDTHERWLQTAKQLQPNLIYRRGWGPDARWGGAEDAEVGDPQWCTFDPARADQRFFGDNDPDDADDAAKAYRDYVRHGDPDGPAFIPAEADPPSYLRGKWFHEDDAVFEPHGPFDGFEQTVWNNAVLNRGLGPDRTGRIPEQVHRELSECRRRREAWLADAVPCVLQEQPTGDAWIGEAPAEAAGMPVRAVMLREAIEHGQTIAWFAIDVDAGDGWRQVHEGRTIGRKKLVRLGEPARDVRRARLRVRAHRGRPRTQRMELLP